MNYRSLLLAFFFLLLSKGSWAQSVYRQKTILAQTQQQMLIDSQLVVPGTFRVYQNGNLVTSYSFNYVSGIFVWKDSSTQFLQLVYRCYPLPITQSYSERNTDIIQPQLAKRIDPFSFPENEPRKTESPLSMSNLSKSGSIARGISVGNTQNLTVNSILDLQINGQLTDDIRVQAAISDNTLPIQPDGNTQQLQEFDKVYIKLDGKQQSLIAGDFDIRSPDGHFLRFYKRTKGAYYTGNFTDQNQRKAAIGAAFAIAKGKYARNTFFGQEGNQGPYRLKGNAGEFYIVILSGTERVFLDGQLLKRGQEYDYTINYNTAEISFTPKHLINQYSRIAVEFEYSDKNFARSLTYLSATLQASSKTTLHLHYYSEQDNKNQPLLQDLNTAQRQFLAGIGDNTATAFYPNIDSVDFSGSRVLYKKIDTLGYSNVLVYSTDSSLAHYQASFTLLGMGKGNYRLRTSGSANGRVFEWIAPISGQAQGDYEPVNLLIAPKRSQLLTIGLDQQLDQHFFLQTEWAISKTDINLYSTKDDGNNSSWAQRSLLKRTDSIGSRGIWINTLSYEFDRRNFRPVERYQEPQFERTYNTTLNDSVAFSFLTLRSELAIKDLIQSFYSLEHLRQESKYEGLRHLAGIDLQTGKYRLNYQGSFLNSRSTRNGSTYFKQNTEASRSIFGWRAGLNSELEHNELKDRTADTLLLNSFSFYQYGAFITSKDSSRNSFKASYIKRFDQSPKQNDFTALSSSDNYTLDQQVQLHKNSQLRLGAAYRSLKTVNNPFVQKIGLGRIGYDFSFCKGALRGNSYYESGIGQEPKRVISYQKVADGTGVYTWRDYNSNGVEELNEFEIAPYRDQANYIRLLTPSSEFARSANLKLSQSLFISPALLFSAKGNWNKVLRFFENELSFFSDQRSLNPLGKIKLNPLSGKDSSLLSTNNNLRNTIFFNRSSAVIAGDISFTGADSKLLLVNGYDKRRQRGSESHIRWTLIQALLLQLTYTENLKSYEPGYQLNNSYRIYSRGIEPSGSWSPNTEQRFTLSYLFRKDHNLSGLEKAENQSIGAEYKFSKASKGVLTLNSKYIHFRYTGALDNNVAFELLQGLKPGNNLTWGASLSRNLSDGLQMTVQYEGRKSELSSAVHLGSVQLRALF